MTVTATKVAMPAFDVPASIDLLPIEQQGLGASLAESLQDVPGLLARERQNYAQDTQISVRGFGARSPFGIRGVRLYVDGVPATQPDGQGQISHFNLATAERVEVLRGPFSALYGNSSGGVIQVFTADSTPAPELALAAFSGDYGDRRLSLLGRGGGLTVGYTDLRTEGFRDHSAAQRRSFNAKLDQDMRGGDKLTLLLNHFEAPNAQDPLGLMRAQFEADPTQTASAASPFDTRKSARQTQIGAVYQQAATPWGALRLMGYGGRRGIEQFLAIPIGTQANPTSAGGVVDLATDYGGGDARWTYQHEALVVSGGLSLDSLRQHRRGFENFIGTQTGVRGELRRDESNTVTSFDQYLQLDWRWSARWSTLAGLRHSQVRFQSRDRYVQASNPDDSGAVDYSAWTPAAAVLFKQSPRLHAYASYGTGFETPTFAELAYRPDGQAGLNFALDPSRTRNAEAGLKLRPAANTKLTLAIFNIEARDELVTVSNAGGRASFANAARTRRQGAELSLDTALGSQIDLAVAYTHLHAEVTEAYRTCASVPCTTAQVEVARGNRLPGVAQGQWFSRLRYAPQPEWQLAAEYRYLDAVPVNDINSESAPSYGVVDVETTYQMVPSAKQRVQWTLKLENLLDQSYAGSVIVNDANGRYYEPARGRAVLVGVQVLLKA
ncbi:MAG: TonB-dependent receptor [Stagnimonas sp.]|nr:TonB-dependent receptor [Stagnimonas sp.]